MRVFSIVFPFRQTFRRLELEKRWWHRLCVVLFAVLLSCVTLLASWLTYITLAPQITTMPEITRVVGADIFDQVQSDQKNQGAAQDPQSWFAQHLPEMSDKIVEMPDGSILRVARSVPDDAIREHWNQAKRRQTLKAILWTVLATLITALFVSYLSQAAYRAFVYVIFGNATQTT